MRHGHRASKAKGKNSMPLQKHALNTEISSVGMVMIYPPQQVRCYIILKMYAQGLSVIKGKGHSVPPGAGKMAQRSVLPGREPEGHQEKENSLDFLSPFLLILSFILFKTLQLAVRTWWGISVWMSSWDSTLRSQVWRRSV